PRNIAPKPSITDTCPPSLHHALPISPAVDAAQVRGGDDHHGARVPALPAVRRRRTELDSHARDDRHPPRVHHRGTAHLTRRPLRSEEHMSELQSREKLVCRLLL